MKKLNITFGVILIACAAFFFLYAGTFQTLPGQLDIGPAAFPRAVCVGLALCGALLIFSEIKKTDTAPANLFNVKFFIGVATAIGYFLLLKPLGFVVSSMLAVLIMMLLLLNEPLKKAWPLILIVSIAAPIVLQLIFGVFLKVPLPEGILAPILS